jgi:translation initiation factor 1
MKDNPLPDDLANLLDLRSDLDRAFAREGSSVRMRIESRRYGKLVTVLSGFADGIDLEPLARELKRHVGAGGTFKDGTIELQGDHRKAVRPWLESRGYRVSV